MIRELGRGACGTVYLVEKNSKYYALKKILIKALSKEDLGKCKNEIEILSSFDNEFIVKYHTYFIQEDFLYILMEYGGDKNLKLFIEEKKKIHKYIDENIIKNIIIQICLGLKEIHEKKVMHRDLTPDNIFINENYQIKIGDFGISKKLKTNVEYTNAINGKFKYFAPELVKGIKNNHKIDIYAFGCIIYELFTLNEYYIDTVIDKKKGKIDLKIYNKKWQELIESLLNADHHKRPEAKDIIMNEKYFKKSEIQNMLKINDKNKKLPNIIYQIKDKNLNNFCKSLINKQLILNINPLKEEEEEKVCAFQLLISKNNLSNNSANKEWIRAWHGANYKNLESILKFGFKLPGSKLKDGSISPETSYPPKTKEVAGIKNWEKAIFASPCIYGASEYSKGINDYQCIIEVRLRNFTKHKLTAVIESFDNKGRSFEKFYDYEIYRVPKENDIFLKSILFIEKNFLKQEFEDTKYDYQIKFLKSCGFIE